MAERIRIELEAFDPQILDASLKDLEAKLKAGFQRAFQKALPKNSAAIKQIKELTSGFTDVAKSADRAAAAARRKQQAVQGLGPGMNRLTSIINSSSSAFNRMNFSALAVVATIP